ncbi:MAG: TetR/AcrR family transcriptional regulator [FCB group bacterium]|nr:TetR/AcrR family transcriptional regulator [FCB group bacterium]
MTDDLNNKRELILRTALEEINTFGIRGFTVDRLAQNLSISKKTIYEIFPAKDILIGAAFRQIQLRIQHEFHLILETGDSPVIQFVRMLDVARSIIGEFNVQVIGDLKRRYPEVWKQIEKFRHELTQIFHDLLIQGRDQGLIRESIDVNIASILHINIINQLFHPEFFLSNNITPRETITVYKEILTGGLLTEQGHRQLQNISST